MLQSGDLGYRIAPCQSIFLANHHGEREIIVRRKVVGFLFQNTAVSLQLLSLAALDVKQLDVQHGHISRQTNQDCSKAMVTPSALYEGLLRFFLQ